MGNERKLSNIFAASAFLCVVLVGTRLLSAQTVREPATSPVAVPQQTPAAIGSTEKTNDEGVAPIYGLQGVLIETLDGRVVSMQAADQKFNPASSIKLATAFVALHNLGPNHRFSTGFWTDGTLDKTTGTLHGNLYVTGRDPSFHHEHAIMIALQLNSLGIRTVDGNLIVSPGFTMNFNSSARGSGKSLYETPRRRVAIQRSDACLDLRTHSAWRSVQSTDSSQRGGDGRNRRWSCGPGCKTSPDAQLKQACRRAQSVALLFKQFHGGAAGRQSRRQRVG